MIELFPISSLGHSVLLPNSWDGAASSAPNPQPESFFLAFVVALHVGTALALVLYFRTVFATPLHAACFLVLNGIVLLAGERYRRRAEVRALVATHAATHSDNEEGRRLDTLDFRKAVVIGVARVGALLAGISRSGITTVAGLVRGLDHGDAARLSFPLATPIILGAGLYKLPDLFGGLGDGVRGPAMVGAVVAGIAAYVSVRFLMRFFETRTLWPFSLYCIAVGVVCNPLFA